MVFAYYDKDINVWWYFDVIRDEYVALDEPLSDHDRRYKRA